MKTKIGKLIMLICLTFFISGTATVKVQAQPGVSVSFQVFYDELSPYGQWIMDPSYGYVWVPDVDNGFRPYYTGGHWVMTEYGNMWMSDYPWGWAPFHYGRWTHDRFYGWVWIPGTEWGPAWVTWRASNDFYGWAPMGPGISLAMSFGGFNPPGDWWVFVPPVFMYYPHWHRYCHNHRDNITIINRTTIINNTYTEGRHTYVGGPRVEQVRRITHRDVPVYHVRNESRPGLSGIRHNAVVVYRPSVERTERAGAPRTFRKAERPVGQPQPVNELGEANRSRVPAGSHTYNTVPSGRSNVRSRQYEGRQPQAQPPVRESRQNNQVQPPARETNQPPRTYQQRNEPGRQVQSQPPLRETRNQVRQQPPAREMRQQQPQQQPRQGKSERDNGKPKERRK